MPVAAIHNMKPTDDPFDEALKPPIDESPEDRELRIAREDEARRVSLAIDASIKAERQARRKKRIVRLLLLGQSESGKSTTLRQFQRLYTPTAFREERILWRAVIQLNIVRSIRTILDAVARPASPSTSPTRGHRRSPSNKRKASHSKGGSNDFVAFSQDSSIDARLDSGNESEPDSDPDNHFYRSQPALPPPSSSFDDLRMRLLPLKHIEQLLIAKLVPPDEDEATHLAGPSHSSSVRTSEIFVRPGPAWKGGLARARVHYPSSTSIDTSSSSGGSRPVSAGDIGLESPDEPQEVLHSCRRDMIQLWSDKGVRRILKKKRIRLEEFPGFFLNDLERITSLKYMPTDDDVLKARLKTVGVSEYRFEMEVSAGRDSGTEWRIVDVGGSRSQRQTWVPFFDDVDAIIFLAPISGFDQVLSEDRTVNRLVRGPELSPSYPSPDCRLQEDSVLLWKAVCQNKLLANVDLVLFLNKCDILESKLKSGIRLSKYVRSYGDRENDLDTVSKYLRSKFNAIHREYSPNPRKFYAFCTSVTDTATTAGIIASVRDMVIRQHLKQSKLL
ncbi:guanine nucleotide-binding protein alpha-4 subunit [Desarmillaria tabescens]|uniref:Guanine nucleotide-binding protein alpha-4 subunit n=1 Tax=Armillaria tabescens TaxID=1929756 RepID=A0AA39MZS5_ARMTA|nr:guanine nucleotide-binding protein alpha-4 subunit [Desarmillaria tabescens]KAK0452104.1 guanine nucleotide-binding protein alpha-4 subunit [Desarmillaria tabescens]